MACNNYVQHQVLTVDFNVHEAGLEKLHKDQGRATAAPELSADQEDTCLHEFCIAEMKQTSQPTLVIWCEQSISVFMVIALLKKRPNPNLYMV